MLFQLPPAQGGWQLHGSPLALQKTSLTTERNKVHIGRDPSGAGGIDKFTLE